MAAFGNPIGQIQEEKRKQDKFVNENSIRKIPNIIDF